MAGYEAGDLVRCEVIFDIPIVDRVTGADVEKGGVVQLEAAPENNTPPWPGQTRIDLLVECGLIKVLPAAAKADTKTKE